MATQVVDDGFSAEASNTQLHRNDEAEALDERRQDLKRRRTLVICAKVFFNILFLFSWSFVLENPRTYRQMGEFLGGSFRAEFAIYTGISAGLPLFSFIGLLKESPLTSHVWFEICWLLGVSGVDGWLIQEQTRFWPPFKEWSQIYIMDPWLTVSRVLYAIALFSLSLDLLLSLLWSISLGRQAWRSRREHPHIWFASAQGFGWLSPGSRPHRVSSIGRAIFGKSKGPSTGKRIMRGFRKFVFGLTPFHRFGTVEPLSYAILRGGLAFLLWLILIAYGIKNCVILPLRQFDPPKGTPMKLLPKDDRYSTTWGHVAGFYTLDVVPVNEIPNYDDLSNQETSDFCYSIRHGIQVNVTDPETNIVKSCPVSCGLTGFIRGDGSAINFVQVDAIWDCGPIWDVLAFKTATKAPDTRPYVSVSFNSAAYNSTSDTITAGLMSVLAEEPADFDFISAGGDPNVHEWVPGVTFNLTAGLAYNVQAGRRKIYGNRATFLDLIGLQGAPKIIATYPILSVDTDVSTTDASITTLTFHPGFGAYNDEIYEEYLEKTVLTGIAQTGGIYTAFNVFYLVLFGRSLLSSFTGGKPIGPFGKIASLLQVNSFRKGLRTHYPGIDGTDESKKAAATTNFLHDFVLDLRPLNLEPSYESKKKKKDVQPSSPDSGGTERKLDSEVPEKGSLAPELSYNHGKTGGELV